MKLLSFTPLVLSVLVTGCYHTSQQYQEPTKEQKLDLYTTTATYLYEGDDLLRAQEQAVKALEIDSDNETMRRMIGWIRLRLGSEEDVRYAEIFFRELVKDGDQNPATILGLAVSCERIGNVHDSYARAIEAGKQQPTDNRTPEQVALYHHEVANGRWNEAITHIEGILQKDEGSTAAMNALQRLYAATESFEESLSWSEKLLERSDEELATWRRMLTSEHLTPEEEAFFRDNESRAHQLRTQTHIFAATLLYKQDRPQDALNHLDLVVKETPQMAHAHSMRAQMLYKLGEYKLAISDLDRFLSLSDSPNDHPDVRQAFELRSKCERELALVKRRDRR